ncbi:MAG: hypothetical protein QM776_09680 [Rhodocyclaceae bacterium]
MFRPAFLLLALVLVLTACSKLTLANYERVSVGMSYDEVVSILGKPTSCNDVLVTRSCRWGDEKRGVSVRFVGGKVLVRSADGLN